MKSDRWPRLRPLLDHALDLDADARRAFLISLEGADAELRDELARLLVEHDTLGRQTMPNAMDLAVPAVADRLHEDQELDLARIGQSIGPYRLVRLLGAGGMGAVYLAERSEQGFTHQVALKVVRKALGSQSARDRFERERQILANLKHPGIALLFDGGQTSEGQSYYTMEYVDGETITDYCDRRAASVDERVRLLLQVAATLGYAHQNLIAHRDIKPSNVLVTADGRVKLVDFGLAKLIDEHTMPTMTQTGLGPMTPVYAAPEQFLNKPTTLATDIYQFGALAFFVLSGRLPFRADPNDSLNWARAVTEEEPMTLSQAAATALDTSKHKRPPSPRYGRELTRDLDAIARKCLSKLPDRRYRSADALISDLEAFLENKPVTARPAGPLYFAWRFVQRRRIASAATALAILAILVIGTLALRQWYVAAENAQRASREADIRNVTRAMLTDLLRVGPASATNQSPRSALEALDQGAERTLQTLGANPQHRAIAAAVLAESYLELEHPQRARDLIERVLPTIPHHADLRLDELQLDVLLGRATAALGDVEKSKNVLAEADATIEALDLPRDTPTRLAAALAKSDLLEHEGNNAEAGKLLTRLLRESDHPDLNATLEFADLLNKAAGYDDAAAETMLERASNIISAHYGRESSAALAMQRKLLIHDYYGERRFNTDQLLSDQAVSIGKSFGTTSLDYADIQLIRCDIADSEKRFAEAEQCYRGVMEIYEQAPDAELLLATVHDNLGATLLHEHRPAEALPYFERELALRLKNFGPTHPNVLHARLSIAKTRCLIKDLDRSIDEFDSAIVDFAASVGPLHPYEAVWAASFATCLLDSGRVKAARSILDAHGKLEPPRKDMTDEDRAIVVKAWEQLSESEKP